MGRLDIFLLERNDLRLLDGVLEDMREGDEDEEEEVCFYSSPSEVWGL